MIFTNPDSCPEHDPGDVIVVCNCSRLDHAVRFHYDPEDDLVYVTVVLQLDPSFWRRARVAWRYLIGGDRAVCAFGACTEALIPAGELFDLVHSFAAEECAQETIGDA